jgi:hypothetical protein
MKPTDSIAFIFTTFIFFAGVFLNNASGSPLGNQEFVTTVGNSGLIEVELGKLAKNNSDNDLCEDVQAENPRAQLK